MAQAIKVHDSHELYKFGDKTVFYSKFLEEYVNDTKLLVCVDCRDYDYRLEQPCRGKE